MKLFIALSCALLVAVFVVWPFMYREVFSDAIRARLKPGMTTNEVIAILGVPSGAKTISRAIRGKDPRATVFLDSAAQAVSSTGELLDPWGTAYKFYRADDEIIIRSAGPNRLFNKLSGVRL